MDALGPDPGRDLANLVPEVGRPPGPQRAGRADDDGNRVDALGVNGGQLHAAVDEQRTNLRTGNYRCSEGARCRSRRHGEHGEWRAIHGWSPRLGEQDRYRARPAKGGFRGAADRHASVLRRLPGACCSPAGARPAVLRRLEAESPLSCSFMRRSRNFGHSPMHAISARMPGADVGCVHGPWAGVGVRCLWAVSHG